MRNNTIDKLKFWLAFMVVAIHIGTPFYDCYAPFLSIAVPCFFMISGYLISKGDVVGNINKAISKTAQLLLWSTLFYAPIKCFQSYWYNDWNWATWERVFDFLLLNQNPFVAHLWYLSAYIYALVLIRLLYSHHLMAVAKLLTPLLIAASALMNVYGQLLTGDAVSMLYYRNWLLQAFPCAVIGMTVSGMKLPRSRSFYVCALSCSFLIFMAETTLLYIFYGIWCYGLYLSTPLLGGVVLIYCANYNSRDNVIARLGRKYSLGIYIFHMAVGIGCGMSGVIRRNPSLEYVAPVIVLILTMVFIYFSRKLLERIGILDKLILFRV